MTTPPLRLTVSVTDADIDNGYPLPERCPVALGTNRALAAAGLPDLSASYEPYRAFCDPDGLEVCNRDGNLAYKLDADDCPSEMYEFASMFDDWHPRRFARPGDADYLDRDGLSCDRPSPIEFVLEIPVATPEE